LQRLFYFIKVDLPSPLWSRPEIMVSTHTRIISKHKRASPCLCLCLCLCVCVSVWWVNCGTASSKSLVTKHESRQWIIYRVGQIKRGQCSFFRRGKAHFREFLKFLGDEIIVHLRTLWSIKIKYFSPEGTTKANDFLCSSILAVSNFHNFYIKTVLLTNNFCGTTRSSAVAERPLDASYLSVVSFNIPTAQFFLLYCGFRFTSA